MTDTNSKAKSCLMGCGLAAIMPVVLIIIFAAILIINNRPPSIVVPSHSVPKVNGYDDFKLAGEMARKTLGPYSDSNGPDSWTMPRLKSFVEANEPMLAVLRRGLTKECMNLPVRDYSVEFPENSGMREAARAVRGEALYYRKKGDYGKAADTLLDGVEFGVMVPRGGVLVSGLVGRAIEDMTTEDMPAVLIELNHLQLDRVAKRLENIQKKRWPCSEITIEEGRFYTAGLVAGLKDPKERDKMMNPRNWMEPCSFTYLIYPGDIRTLSDRLYFILPNARFALMNKSKLVRETNGYFLALASEQRRPYIGRSKLTMPTIPIVEVVDPIFNNLYEGVHLAFCFPEAKLALLQTDVAIRRYFADNNRYPNNSAQLVPKYLKSLPIDPFGNGKRIKYLRKGTGSFVVYSLGANLKDDGGTPGKWRGAPASGDLVLGQGEK